MKIYLNEKSSIENTVHKLSKKVHDEVELEEVKNLATSLISDIKKNSDNGINLYLSKTHKLNSGKTLVMHATSSRQQSFWARLRSS